MSTVMTPRFQCLPRPPLPRPVPPGGLPVTVSASPAADGIARVPRLAVARPVPAPAAGAAPAGGGHGVLRDILSGLVQELAGEAARGMPESASGPVPATAGVLPSDPPPGRRSWRRTPSPLASNLLWDGVICAPRRDSSLTT